MGRGLSDLQKTILRVALENRDEGGHIDAYHGEILEAHFRWPRKRFPFSSCAEGAFNRGGRPRGGWNFSKNQIGANRYNSAHASLARAIRRLKERGLLDERHLWVKLTGAGVEVARELSVNPPPNSVKG